MNRRKLLATIPSATLIAGCNTRNEWPPDNESDSSEQDNDSIQYGQPAQFDEVKSLTVANYLNETVTASIVVTDNATGEILSETTVTVPPDGGRSDKGVPVADESGDYTAEITINGQGTAKTEFDLRTPVLDPVLYIQYTSREEGESFSVGIDEAPAV